MDLLDLLSGETTPSHSPTEPSNTGSRNSEDGRGKKSSPPQNIPTTATDRLLTNELAAVFATPSAELQQPSGGSGYAHHHQGGMPNYAQQQQYMPAAPDGTLYVQQQQPVNAFPPVSHKPSVLFRILRPTPTVKTHLSPILLATTAAANTSTYRRCCLSGRRGWDATATLLPECATTAAGCSSDHGRRCLSTNSNGPPQYGPATNSCPA